ncbi:MAG TPA: recombination mediator RecR [Thermodesulfovibrionales bacterium]|nr:recombination mediator RecR [Thermodesulfovibrionales bacterium]
MTQGIIENLIQELTKLPGIGRKSAQRLAFFILTMPAEEAKGIAKAIEEVKERARFCSRCFNITDADLCELCRDPHRDHSKVCVVEEPSNILVVERSGVYRGLYHVLLGSISPMDGVTPEKLKIRELIDRISADHITEVIIATNPNTKGEITAQYIRERLSDIPVTVTRIAYGLPMGSDIEFADEVTLSKALEGRRQM